MIHFLTWENVKDFISLALNFGTFIITLLMYFDNKKR